MKIGSEFFFRSAGLGPWAPGGCARAALGRPEGFPYWESSGRPRGVRGPPAGVPNHTLRGPPGRDPLGPQDVCVCLFFFVRRMPPLNLEKIYLENQHLAASSSMGARSAP